MIGPSPAGFVLAGGASTRMGRDKARVELGGERLAARAVRIVKEAGLPAYFAGARPDLADLAESVADERPGLGPLGGICAALRTLGRGLGVFVTVDAPFLPAELLRWLAWRAEMTGAIVTLSSVGGRTQPFPAMVDARALPGLEAELAAGRGGCLAGFRTVAGGHLDKVAAEVLAQSGQVGDPKGLFPWEWYRNLNTPEMLKAAETNQGASNYSSDFKEETFKARWGIPL